MWDEPAGVVADQEELGAALRPFNGECGRIVGGKERHARQHALNDPRAGAGVDIDPEVNAVSTRDGLGKSVLFDQKCSRRPQQKTPGNFPPGVLYQLSTRL
jgi:hypothetical protein